MDSMDMYLFVGLLCYVLAVGCALLGKKLSFGHLLWYLLFIIWWPLPLVTQIIEIVAEDI